MTAQPENPADGTASTASSKLRFAPSDARYGQGLIAGAKVMEIFGDLETEIAIREAGDEGLCIGYDVVEFLEPLFVGDFVEARASVIERGETSRKVELELHRVVKGSENGTAEVCNPPVLAARARATIVVGSTDRVVAAAEGTVASSA